MPCRLLQLAVSVLFNWPSSLESLEAVPTAWVFKAKPLTGVLTGVVVYHSRPLVPSTHRSHHPSPLQSFIPGLKPSFSAILPTVAFLFFSRTRCQIPQTATDTSAHIRFYFLVLLFLFKFLVLCGRLS